MSIVEMKVPVIGESVNEVTLSQWLKGNGEYVKLDEPICEFESDKATLEFPAEAAGKLIYVAAEDDDLEIGALVAKIDTSVAAPAADAPAATPPPAEEKKEVVAETVAAPSASYASGHPSPAADKILKENGVAANQVSGTGVGGRITKEDAQKAVATKSSAPAPAAKPATPAPTVSAPSANFSRETSRKKMSRMRRTIASRLVSAKNNTAMLTTFNEVDLTEVMKLTRDGSLTLDEMKGGTFAITNGGIFGSMMSTPILNEPQSAILGMHTIQQRPMAIDGEVKIRPMMYLALSYDHRVIDGSTSVTFLVKVKNLLEDPVTLLMDL